MATIEQLLSLSGTALVVVDLQNDFTQAPRTDLAPGKSCYVEGAERVVKFANYLSMFSATCVYARRWHPPAHVSFASSHAGYKAGDIMRVGQFDQRLWPAHCVRESWGARFDSGLEIRSRELIVDEGADARYDSHSAFFDDNGTRGLGLKTKLDGRFIDTLVIIGVERGAANTALDAALLGYRSILLRSPSRSLCEKDLEARLAELKNFGVEIY